MTLYFCSLYTYVIMVCRRMPLFYFNTRRSGSIVPVILNLDTHREVSSASPPAALTHGKQAPVKLNRLGSPKYRSDSFGGKKNYLSLAHILIHTYQV